MKKLKDMDASELMLLYRQAALLCQYVLVGNIEEEYRRRKTP